MTSNLTTDRVGASDWARDLLAEAQADPRSWIILDTETTGLPQDEPEVVQIGLLWPDGTVALDSLVRPCMDHKNRREGQPLIPVAASSVHGITDATVADAPDLFHLLPAMAEAMHGRKVIVYNVAYDFEVLLGCLYRRKCALPCLSFLTDPIEKPARTWAYDWLNSCPAWECAMERYAAYCGDWNSYHRSYRWQRLPPVPGVTAHSAIGDCKSTLHLIRRMAEGE